MILDILNNGDPTTVIFGLVFAFTLFFAGIPLGIFMFLRDHKEPTLRLRLFLFLLTICVIVSGIYLFHVGYPQLHEGKAWVVGWLVGLFLIPHVINAGLTLRPLTNIREYVAQLFLFSLLFGIIFPLLGLIKFMDTLDIWT